MLPIFQPGLEAAIKPARVAAVAGACIVTCAAAATAGR
jgi:hypothetical protein